MNKYFKKIKIYILLTLIILYSITPLNASAIDIDFYNSNDILYYNPEDCIVIGTGDSSLVGNDNLEKILRYYVGKGLSLAQASGIAGNYEQESGFNPAIIQGGNQADENYTPVNSVGFGIAQWTFNDRQLPLVALSKSSNRTIIDLSLQLDYSWEELNSNRSGALVTLKEATTPEDAAYVFHRDFEGSNDSEYTIKEVRGGNAKIIYNTFASTIPDSTSTSLNTSTLSDKSNLCTGDNSNSQFSNGFTFYDQNNPLWKDESYGAYATIGESGCGPSAMAMIITALTSNKVTPLDTATYGAINGTTANGGRDGSNWNIQTIIGEHWGLTSTQLTNDVTAVNSILKNDGLVITSGAGAEPFTSGGHYIVIRAVTDSGKWLIGDSFNTANNTKEYDPTYILNIASSSNIWGITK